MKLSSSDVIEIKNGHGQAGDLAPFRPNRSSTLTWQSFFEIRRLLSEITSLLRTIIDQIEANDPNRYRSFDDHENTLGNPDLGQAETHVMRPTDADHADGESEISGGVR